MEKREREFQESLNFLKKPDFKPPHGKLDGARGGGSGGRSAGGRHPDQASGQPGAACAPLGCLAPSKLPPSRQPGSRTDNSCKLSRPCLLQGSSSEDAGFLSHVHTDRPLGRPRGPLLQQHVGLLVVQRRRPAAALLDLVVQVVNCYRSR